MITPSSLFPGLGMCMAILERSGYILQDSQGMKAEVLRDGRRSDFVAGEKGTEKEPSGLRYEDTKENWRPLPAGLCVINQITQK